MKKVIFYILLSITIIVVLMIGSYKLISYLDFKSKLLELDKHNLVQGERKIKEFQYNKKNYIITSYYDNTSSWGHLNIMIKNKNLYYLLDNLKRCDSDGKNIYVKENKIYIHCIGRKGDIIEYTIKGAEASKNTISFNYKNTPNISQIHMIVDRVDDDYIYLSSSVKIDDLVKEGNRIKCLLEDKICNYY